MTTPSPSIQPWLDDAGLNRYEFRILATISRRAGRNGTCYETVKNMAQRCRMSKSVAQRALRSLTKNGLIRVTRPATPNAPTCYALTRKLHLNDDDLLALFVPAALDDSAITPEAFRLYLHYVRWAWDGEVSANHARAARACGAGLTSRASAVKFEAELVSQKLLEPRGRSGKHGVFAIGTRPPVHEVLPVAEAPTPQPFTRYTPTVHEVHPNRSRGTPKGLLEGSYKGRANNDFFKNFLGREYGGFVQFVEKSSSRLEVFDRWLADWGEQRIEKVWAYLGENENPWTTKHGARFGRLYGLYDTLEGQFQNGEPHALCMLWVQMEAEKNEKKRALRPHFDQGDIVQVRDLTERFEVDILSGKWLCFTNGRQADATECRVVGKAATPVVTAADLVPPLARRRAAAAQRRAQLEAAR